jgi:PKD repeat protein
MMIEMMFFRMFRNLLVTGFYFSVWYMMIEMKIGMLGNPAGNGVSFLFLTVFAIYPVFKNIKITSLKIRSNNMKLIYSHRLSMFTFLIIGITNITAYGQQKLPCGTDIVTQQLLKQYPELIDNYNKYETYTQDYVRNLEAQKLWSPVKITGTAPTVYIIPVVFHILHQNGPEDISDSQVFDEMRILNEDWGHTNPDTGEACTPHFKSIEGNNQVQFRLAQKDPNGNCTNGIDRIFTNLTNNANDVSKINGWDPTKYVNIWVVKSITVGGVPDIAGYAYFPWEVQNDNLYLYDGVLILNNYIGTIGTSSPSTSRALSHELGHVMNLEHPWGLTNSPGVTGPHTFIAGHLCGDDGVNDTPYTMGYDLYCPSDSNFGKFCDTVSKSPLYVLTENYQNFMEYSYCSMMFTQGQQERVWAALNSSVAYRSSLWDTANLIATGVYTPPVAECTPEANFYSNTCFVCQGASVNFYDASANAEPTRWLWKFSGAIVDSSTTQNPIVTFDSLYRQTISLTASDNAGSNTLTKYGYIYVSPFWTDYYGSFSENFENPVEVNNNWLFQNVFNNSATWQVTNTAAESGTGSLMLNSYQVNIYNYEFSPPELISPAIGGSAVWDAITPSVNLQTASGLSLSFGYSCATEAVTNSAISETLEIAYSLDCGASWVALKTLSGTTLANAGFSSSFYTPSSPLDWQNISIPLGSILDGKPNVRFKFEYTSGVYSNNIYLDNINLTGTVGMEQVSVENNQLLVYPNPMHSEATLSYYLSNNQFVNIGLYDVAGREIYELINTKQGPGQHYIYIYSNNLSGGIYFIKMITGNSKSVTEKLIIIK